MDPTQSVDAYAAGRRVGREGLSPSNNPFRDDDALHKDWHMGWQEGNRERANERRCA